jgi:hypothetical protein
VSVLSDLVVTFFSSIVVLTVNRNFCIVPVMHSVSDLWDILGSFENELYLHVLSDTVLTVNVVLCVVYNTTDMQFCLYTFSL